MVSLLLKHTNLCKLDIEKLKNSKWSFLDLRIELPCEIKFFLNLTQRKRVAAHGYLAPYLPVVSILIYGTGLGLK